MSMADYFQGLDFLESDVGHRTPPRPETLASWRKRHPDKAFCLVAPAAPEEWAVFFDGARALLSNALLFRTPAGVNVSASQTETAQRFFAQAKTACPSATLVWDTEGVWPSAALPALADWNVTLAYDPLQNDPLEELDRWHHLDPGGIGYFRLRALGQPAKSFTRDRLEALAALCATKREVWVAFGNMQSFDDARRLRALLAET
jgi:hypothetical protein